LWPREHGCNLLVLAYLRSFSAAVVSLASRTGYGLASISDVRSRTSEAGHLGHRTGHAICMQSKQHAVSQSKRLTGCRACKWLHVVDVILAQEKKCPVKAVGWLHASGCASLMLKRLDKAICLGQKKYNYVCFFCCNFYLNYFFVANN
jgi:hypothetical protein